jgi:hypothetical protein
VGGEREATLRTWVSIDLVLLFGGGGVERGGERETVRERERERERPLGYTWTLTWSRMPLKFQILGKTQKISNHKTIIILYQKKASNGHEQQHPAAQPFP